MRSFRRQKMESVSHGSSWTSWSSCGPTGENPSQPERVFLVTGMLAHPMVEALAGELSRITGHRVEALAVANRFFGERITVTGLLTGGDILAAIRAAGPANRVYVPDVLLNAGRFPGRHDASPRWRRRWACPWMPSRLALALARALAA